jgi:hypothetical protein
MIAEAPASAPASTAFIPELPVAQNVDELRALRDEVQALNQAIGRRDVDSLEGEVPSSAIEARIGRIETRLDEQEEVLRHVLARLIEWVERDASRSTLPNRAA